MFAGLTASSYEGTELSFPGMLSENIWIYR